MRAHRSRSFWTRLAVVPALAAALLVVAPAAPAQAQAQQLPIEMTFPAQMPHRGDCIRLTKQLLRYTGDLEMARDRGNDLWEEATKQHMSRLAFRRAELCPSIVAQEDPFWRDLGRILGVAAQAAIKYFTWGAL